MKLSDKLRRKSNGTKKLYIDINMMHTSCAEGVRVVTPSLEVDFYDPPAHQFF